MQTVVYQIVLFINLYKHFSYLPVIKQPINEQTAKNHIGLRVVVDFANRKNLIGVVVGFEKMDTSKLDYELKNIKQLLEKESRLNTMQIKFGLWLSYYYKQALGETLALFFPTLLKIKPKVQFNQNQFYELTAKGKNFDCTSLRSTKQKEVLRLMSKVNPLSLQILKSYKVESSTLLTLVNKELINKYSVESEPLLNKQEPKVEFELTSSQQKAISIINQSLGKYKTLLLMGDTNSGKTEVYLNVMKQVLAQKKQVLYLVPEIALIKQSLERIKQRFSAYIISYHSDISHQDQHNYWCWIQTGKIDIIIATRSGLFLPFKNLGLIVIDEEHDRSYKQSEQLNYSAKNAAIKFASKLKIPVLLGSATPSIESYYNALNNKYQLLSLEKRFESNNIQYSIVSNMNVKLQSKQIFTKEINEKIKAYIKQNQQVLVYVNNRGFAKLLYCVECKTKVNCPNCSTTLHFHKYPKPHLYCHYCAYKESANLICKNCQNTLYPIGIGTEKVVDFLQSKFDCPIVQFDSDHINTDKKRQEILERINRNNAMIIVGTQMISKGHHFKKLSLILVINSDNALYANDFRGKEKFVQSLIQVTGRVGREQQKSEVIVLSELNEQDLFKKIFQRNYKAIADEVLEERKIFDLPPFWYIALIKSEHRNEKIAEQNLSFLVEYLQQDSQEKSLILGPVKAILYKKNKYFRYLLLLKSLHRNDLQQTLNKVLQFKQVNPNIRLAIEVDPMEID